MFDKKWYVVHLLEYLTMAWAATFLIDILCMQLGIDVVTVRHAQAAAFWTAVDGACAILARETDIVRKVAA